MPRLDARLSGISNTVTMNSALQRGVPGRIEAFDDLNIKSLRIGPRHTAVISEDGMLYTFGYGNWGVLGHGNEGDIQFNKPKMVAKFE